MKVEVTGKNYKFKDDNDNYLFRFSFMGYPACCLMGFLFEFGMGDHQLFKEHKKEIHQYILNMMELFGINQLLIADVRDGAGYILAEDMEYCTPLNVAFNKNSGNFVYLFSVYKEV